MNNFNFSPSTGLLDTSAYPSQPTTEAQARGQFMDLFNQLKDFMNNDIKTEVVNLTTSKPLCRAYGVTQAIPNGTYTSVAFNSERYSVGGLHNTAVNNSRITFPNGGIFSGGANIEYAADTRGQRIARILLNGTTVIARVSDSANQVDSHNQQINFQYKFNPGDYIELQVYQNCSATLNLNAFGNYSPEMWVQKEA